MSQDLEVIAAPHVELDLVHDLLLGWRGQRVAVRLSESAVTPQLAIAMITDLAPGMHALAVHASGDHLAFAHDVDLHPDGHDEMVRLVTERAARAYRQARMHHQLR